MALRDRFFTRRTAEALVAPSSILAAGAGTSVAIIAGWPFAAAGLVGAGVYAGIVALRMPKGAPAPTADIDLSRLRDPWRWYVAEALDSRTRFTRAAASAGGGAIRERLEEIGGRLDDGIAEAWRIANRGQELEGALAELGPIERTEQRLAGLRRTPNADERLASALQAQVDTYRRIERVAAETRDRLQLLEARLDEAVARAVELALRAGDPVELGGLGNDVDELVGEMEALRRGLEEASGRPQAM